MKQASWLANFVENLANWVAWVTQVCLGIYSGDVGPLFKVSTLYGKE